MIYLDNAATTLHKPPEVAEAVKQAILTAETLPGARTVCRSLPRARYLKRGRSSRSSFPARAKTTLSSR